MKKILIICFNNIEFDARSNNMLKTYSDLKYKCYAVHISNNDFFTIPNVTIYCHKASFTLKYATYFSFYRFVKKHLDLIAPDVCIASDLFSLISICFSFRGVKTIYDSREIYSALAGLRNKPIKQKLLALAEKFCVNFCYRIIVTAESDKIYLLKLYKNINISIVKNFPPLHMLPKKTNFLRTSNSIPASSAVLLYQGALQSGRGLFEYIKILLHLKNCYLVIIGDGPIKKQLIDFAVTNSVQSRVVFLSWVPYGKLLELTASADLGLAVIKPLSLSYYNALPNKLFEYALAGIPSIGSNLPEINNILKDVRLGVASEYNHSSILSAIQYVLKNKQIYDPEIIQDIAKKNFVWETQKKILIECINEQ